MSAAPGAISGTDAKIAILEITNLAFRPTRALLLYRLLQLLAFPFVAIYFTARLFQNRKYATHFAERLGLFPQPFHRTKPGSIWLHAVSVGEVASALPLIKALQKDEPEVPIYLSVSTLAGRKAAEKQLGPFVRAIFFAPIDYASCVRRVLDQIRPSLLIVLETEIWPNLYAETKRFGAQLAIVNGRISGRTWPRYLAWKRFFGPILRLANLIIPQSEKDKERYLQLGVLPSRIQFVGNLKYDASFALPRTQVPTFGAEHIWIAASTVGPNERGSIERHSVDEDDLVIQTFQTLVWEFPQLLLILAPRQEARFDAVANKLAQADISYVRRTGVTTAGFSLPGVLLLDTVGELAGTFRSAHVVFVGGSIAPRGGHNILEPAAAGRPIIVGPHMENFEAITNDFLAAGALLQIQSEVELTSAVRTLLLDRGFAEDLGNKACQVVEQNAGIADRIAASLWPLYYQPRQKASHGSLATWLLSPLAWLWCKGGDWKRRTAEEKSARQSKLPKPVISIGGITVGGSGKTPFTSYLANLLQMSGYSSAILTRGYRRRFPAETVILSPGAAVPPAFTGDEAQIFLRMGIGPIGIGAKRYETAQILLSEFPQTDALLLDDGFQHASLERDLDIVLIDGLDPFGGEEVLPLGRLREPLTALRRADAFVVTRAENYLSFEAICKRLAEWNAHAPVFRTRLLPKRWRDYGTGATLSSLRGKRVAAFCGIGNPENFWQTLESLGVEVVFRWSFADHHKYKPSELSRLAHQARTHGADILVTTEKDRINCPDELHNVIRPLELAWLEIELEVEKEAEFLRFVQDRTLSRSRSS